MNENKSNTLLLTVIGVATLLVAVIGASFAYFTAQLSGAETNTTLTVEAGTLTISYDGGPTLNPDADVIAEDLIPITTGMPIITKRFTVKGTNSTNTRMPYSAQMSFSENGFTSPALIYSLECTTSTPNGSPLPAKTITPLPTKTITQSLTLPTDPTELATFKTYLTGLLATNAIPTGTTPLSLGTAYFQGAVSNSVHDYTLIIYFPDNGENQDVHKARDFQASISIAVQSIQEIPVP